jgi:hypothetical protein
MKVNDYLYESNWISAYCPTGKESLAPCELTDEKATVFHISYPGMLNKSSYLKAHTLDSAREKFRPLVLSFISGIQFQQRVILDSLGVPHNVR